MAVTAEEIKGQVDGIVEGITTYQADRSAKESQYDDHIVKTDETLEKHVQDIAEMTEKLQEMGDEFKSEKESFEEEKKTISRMQLEISNGVASRQDGKCITDPEVKNAQDLYMRTNNKDHEISSDIHEKNVIALVKHYMANHSETNQEKQVKKIMSEGAFNSGGMFCPIGMATDIDRRVFETTPILDMATVINSSTSSMEFPFKDELPEVNESSETTTRKQTSVAGFNKIKIETNELNAESKITQWMRDDSSIDIEGEVNQDTSDEFSRQFNSQCTNGDGNQVAKGFMNADVYADAEVDVYERNKLGTLETASAGDFDDEDLIDLQSYVLEPYQPNSSFLMHRRSWAKCIKLKDSEGRYLLDALTLFKNNTTPVLLSAPVRLGGDMVAPDGNSYTTGQRIMAYGDFRRCYTIVRRMGINMIVDPYTEKGFIKYYMYTRMGGGLRNFQGIKRLKIK
jgi:HK97 family phage major capsid protein